MSGNSGVGGSAGSGGAACIVSSPPTEPGNPTNPHVQPDGYYESNELHGYAYTVTDSLGSTIAPNSCSTTVNGYTNVAEGQALCARGNVVAGGYALVGINANATPLGVVSALVPTGTGLSITVTGSATLAAKNLLVKLASSTQNYCAAVPASGVANLLWKDFTTGTCLGSSSGTAYVPGANAGFNDVQLLVQSQNGAASPYDFCITNLEETGTPGGVQGGGYFYAGELHGYASTYADKLGSSIQPANFAGVTTDGSFCAQGTVVADAGFESFAGITVAVNQDAPGTGGPQVLVPTGGGLAFSVSNAGGSPLRAAITNEAGNILYCVTLTNTSITPTSFAFKWSDFNTKCYDAPADGSPFVPATSTMLYFQISIPGSATVEVPYNYCLTALAETN